MVIEPEILMKWALEPVEEVITERDCIFYALSIGLGANPLDANQLRFTYERDLAAFPTLPIVLGYPGPWLRDPRTGIDYSKLVHGGQAVTLHRSIPTSGKVRSTNKVVGLSDKGKDKGAVVYVRRELFDGASDEPIATTNSTVFCRANGGFGGTYGETAQQSCMPEGVPDLIVDIETMSQAALLYRLNGDYNPLHADPEVARAAGFPRPIMHGLCTFGVVTHAILKALCDYDPAGIRRIGARFSSPVMPGEKISIEIWRAGKDISFRAWVMERNAKVVDNGFAELK